MKPNEVKLFLFTSDLAKTQSFYSAIGMEWLGGREVRIGKAGIPEEEERNPHPAGLPQLWGNIGALEFIFYLDETLLIPQLSTATRLRIYYEDDNDVEDALKNLKGLKLLVPGPNFQEDGELLILDPDGRHLELCRPHPYRL